MILQYLFEAMLFVWGNLFSLLPSAPALPAQVWDSFEIIQPYLIIMNRFVPVSTLFQIFGLVLIFEAGMLLFKMINKAIKLVRGSG